MEEIALTVLPTNPDSEDGTDIDETTSQVAKDFLSYSWQYMDREGGLKKVASSNLGIEEGVQPCIDEPRNVDGAGTASINHPTQKSQEIRPDFRCSWPDCGWKFKRAYDLQQHLRTHTRPCKCPVPTCKYHEYGWPTEKLLGRHVNEKHAPQIAMYECEFKPCPYKSKRESNCKQHMEKAHGWTYVRTKNNGKLGRPTPQLAGHRRSSTNLEAYSPPKAVHFVSSVESIEPFRQRYHRESLPFPGKLIISSVSLTAT